MPSYVPPKKNTAYVFTVALVSQTNPLKMQANPTLAAGDVKVSIDNGAQANLATLPTVTPAAGVFVKVSLSAAEMNGDNISIAFIDAAGAEWCDLVINIQTAANQIDDLPALIAAAGTLTSGERNAIADAYLDRVDAIETGIAPRGTLRLLLAALVGKLSGASGTTVTIRNVGDTKNRIVTTVVQGVGDRTGVVTDIT